MADAYRDLTDGEVEEAIRRLAVRVLNLRTVGVVLIYAFALALTGIGIFKSAAFCLSVWLLLIMPLGRSYIEKAGGVWFFAALVAWLDIPQVNRIFEIVGAKAGVLLSAI